MSESSDSLLSELAKKRSDALQKYEKHFPLQNHLSSANIDEIKQNIQKSQHQQAITVDADSNNIKSSNFIEILKQFGIYIEEKHNVSKLTAAIFGDKEIKIDFHHNENENKFSISRINYLTLC
eukprot:199952_1